MSQQKSKVRPHLFRADPDLPPPDDSDGRRYCRCGLLGKPGDSHHAMPPAPADDVQRWRAHDET